MTVNYMKLVSFSVKLSKIKVLFPMPVFFFLLILTSHVVTLAKNEENEEQRD